MRKKLPGDLLHALDLKLCNTIHWAIRAHLPNNTTVAELEVLGKMYSATRCISWAPRELTPERSQALKALFTKIRYVEPTVVPAGRAMKAPEAKSPRGHKTKLGRVPRRVPLFELYHGLPSREAFAGMLGASIETTSLQAYIVGPERSDVLLTKDEINKLASACSAAEPQLLRRWDTAFAPIEPIEPDDYWADIHPLGSRHASLFRKACRRLNKTFTSRRLRLDRGIRAIRRFVLVVRKLLARHNRTDRIPGPEGVFPSPATPRGEKYLSLTPVVQKAVARIYEVLRQTPELIKKDSTTVLEAVGIYRWVGLKALRYLGEIGYYQGRKRKLRSDASET